MLSRLYRPAFGLLTDLYQVTMAYGHWRLGRADWQAVFHWSLRTLPFGGGFAIACGQDSALELLGLYRFEEADLEYLRGLTAPDGTVLFERAFVDYLGGLEVHCDIDAVLEGSVVFPREPLLRISGPLILCQLLETLLLNQLNFQTLIATKAARVCHLAAAGDPVLEMGLRRAQGIDGAITAARAAYVGGCAATSNLLAGRLLEIPVRGTQGHAWVMSFDDEIEAFRAFARVQPGNTTLLVDTYDSRYGIDNAIEVGRELAASGHRLQGIRLDSGDPLELSREARSKLDAAGLDETAIVVSGDLDEHRIAALRRAGAEIDAWGVGTRLVAGHRDAAVAGVFKLAAVRADRSQPFRPVIKISDQPEKGTDPGLLQVRRYHDAAGTIVGDAVYDFELGLPATVARGDVRRLMDSASGLPLRLAGVATEHDLLVPLVRDGEPVAPSPTLDELRQRVAEQIAALPAAARLLDHPRVPAVGLEPRLFEKRAELVRRRLDRDRVEA